jgi:23S rRNA (uracil1939-C5)-methyltransferase
MTGVICPHFGPCGGCVWQDVAYAEQLERKRLVLERLLRPILGARGAAVQPLAGTTAGEDGMPWHFRHKAAFVFGPDPHDSRGFVMGHYAAGSTRIIPIETCPVHSSLANRLAFALRDQLAGARIAAAGPGVDGILRHVVIRTTKDECEAVVMLVVTRNDRSLRQPVRAFVAAHETCTGFLVNVHPRPGPYMVGDDTIRISGRSAVRETVRGARFLVTPTAFFQTNPESAAVLVDEVVSQARVLEQRHHVLDLYAGSGLFAIPLAAGGHAVVAVEENAQAVRDGEANARLNRIPGGRLRFMRARVEDAIVRLARTRPGLAVLDPPRQGCGSQVIGAVFRDLAPPHALYVSCDPESLARELPAIQASGYRVVRVQPIDMFPHTTHIETVVTLERS